MATVVAGFAVVALGSMATPAGANNSWGGYHWGRTANPFTLIDIDSVTSNWDGFKASVDSDWSQSTKLDLVNVQGNEASNSRKRCVATSGQTRSCNQNYGYNGWLGIATIHITTGSHIVDGAVKLNDSYFALSSYNTPEARRHVFCQEVGHILGLDHQHIGDTGGGVTCMNDTAGINDPAYVSPNQHDYDQLNTIYTHTDSINTVALFTSNPLETVIADGTEVTYITWAN